MRLRIVVLIVATAIWAAIPMSATADDSPAEACSFILSDFDYNDWSKRYLDYYDMWFDTPVSEAEVMAYQDEEAQKMGRLYRPPPWRSDIWRVRSKKYQAAYESDVTDQERSAVLATGWPKANHPLEYFKKITERFGELKCDGVPGGGSPPGLYFGAIQEMAFECNKNLSASEPIPCTNIYLGSIARRFGNYDVAFTEFEALAGEGSAEAMFQLGQMYENGEGTAANKEKAKDWYVAAANAGHEEAQSSLDTMVVTEECIDIPEDYVGGEYRAALYSLSKPCHRILSESEQYFMAGFLADALEDVCDGQFGKESRSRLAVFLGSVRGSAPDIGAIEYGLQLGTSFQCSAEFVEIAENLVDYLDRTSKESNFVQTCVEYYRGQYSEEQCRCLTEELRGVHANINTYPYDRRTVLSAMEQIPMAVMTIPSRCRIVP